LYSLDTTPSPTISIPGLWHGLNSKFEPDWGIFFSDFKAASQDILEKVGQEAALKYEEKDAKSEF
jgi:hypothetical protein